MINLIQFFDLQKTEMNNITLLNEFIRRKVSPNGETGRMLSRLFPLSREVLLTAIEVLLTAIHLHFMYSNVESTVDTAGNC